MKTKLFKKLVAIFCTVILLFSAAGCGECNRKTGGNVLFDFDTFKDFSMFHSEYTEIYGIKSLAFNIDDISLQTDKKWYSVNFLDALGNKDASKINKNNLIDYVANASLFRFICAFTYKYDKNLAEKKHYNETNEQENLAGKENGYSVSCFIYSVRPADSAYEVTPNTDNLSYVLVENSSVIYRNYYEYELIINETKIDRFGVTIILNQQDDDLAEKIMQSLIKTAVVLE